MIKTSVVFALAFGVMPSVLPCRGAIVLQAHYRLGEPGSLGGSNLPLDSSGNVRHFVSPNGVTGSVSTSVPGLTGVTNGSTASLFDSAANGGFYNAGGWFPATDNFGIDLWVKTTSLAQNTGIFWTNNVTNALVFQVENNKWAASYSGTAWIGIANGTPNSVRADTWAQLAVVRNNGVSTFYINGIAQPGTVNTLPVMAGTGFHLGVNPGGGNGFTGNIDNLRIWTFNPATDSIASMLVPEPQRASLLLLGSLCLLARRRR